jgi:quercetin dioxygenase-like cupin family protein
MPGYTIARDAEMETNGKWTLVRRALALESFGIGLVDIPPGGDIPAHDETERDQEEVFIVLSGTPTLIVGGDEHDAPAGTYARVDPEVHRQVVNRGDEPARVLIVSAPRGSGYEAMGWN